MNSSVEIKTHIVDSRVPGPTLLITAGVHGDEFEGMVASRRLAKLLADTQMIGRVILAPVVNESAFVKGTRFGGDGLDLARVCPGRSNGTVTEQVADSLSRLIRDADYYIDLHSGGVALCVLPLAGYTLHPDPEILNTQRAMARSFNLPLVWGTTSSLNGRTLSVARDACVPAIYAEYMGSGLCSHQGVNDYIDGCLNVMAYLGMIERSQPVDRVTRVVEDSNPNSGHLQICNPAPITGFFEPLVQVGEHVEVGQVIGSVTDVLGDANYEIVAEQCGTILFLASFSRVIEKTGIAYILSDESNDSSAHEKHVAMLNR